MVSQEKGEAHATSLGPGASYFRTDITNADAVAASCAAALESVPKGSLAGGVHCAAISPARPWSHKLADSVAAFDAVLAVNVRGTFVVDACIADAINSQYPDHGPFAPRVSEERGCVINIASAVARPVPARCITYGPSKSEFPHRSRRPLTPAAVLGISSGMADFLGPFGIRVCSVSPAVVASNMMGPDRVVSTERRRYWPLVGDRILATIISVLSVDPARIDNPLVDRH